MIFVARVGKNRKISYYEAPCGQIVADYIVFFTSPDTDLCIEEYKGSSEGLEVECVPNWFWKSDEAESTAA